MKEDARSVAIDRLLALQLALGALALAVLTPHIFATAGTLPLMAGGLLIGVLWLAWRATDSSRLKLVASIGTCGLAGLMMLAASGANGVSFALIESCVILGAFFLSGKHLWILIGCVAIAMALIVGVTGLDQLYFQRVDPSTEWAWVTLFFGAAPGVAVVLLAQHRVIDELDQENAQLNEIREFLSLETNERYAAQERLRKANHSLEDLVRERTIDLERIREEFEFFSEISLRWLTRPLKDLHDSVERLGKTAGPGLDPSIATAISRMQSRSRGLLRMVEGLRALGGVGSRKLHWQRVELSPIASGIAAELKEGDPCRDVRIVVEPDIVLSADKVLAESVLRNLLDNAWKYTVGRPSAEINVFKCEVCGHPGVCVSDNGRGFAQEDSERLFELFEKSGPDPTGTGSGIGLATVRQVVKRHNGHIEVKAAEGKGVSFALTFGEPPHNEDLISEEEPEEPTSIKASAKDGEVWKLECLQYLLVLDLIAMVATFGPLTYWSYRQNPHWLLIGLWLCVVPYPILIWLRGLPLKVRAAGALAPPAGIAFLAWSHTIDFSGVTLLAENTICFSLLFFGMRVMLGVAAVQVAGIMLGAFLILSGRSMPGILGADPFPYWAQRLPTFIFSTAALLVILRRAKDRLEMFIEENRGLTRSLREEVFRRREAHKAAKTLNEQLDIIVAERTSSLEQAAESMQSFTGMVSHDLRAPLRGLASLSSMTREDFQDKLSAEQLDRLAVIDGLVKVASRSIENLIQLVRELNREGDLEEVNLSQLVALTAERARVSDRVAVTEGLHVRTDRALAELAVKYLMQDAEDNPEARLIIGRRSGADALTVSGNSRDFLNAIQVLGESARSEASAIELYALAPVAFIQICRHQGGKVWVEHSEDGPRLCFNLAGQFAFAT